MVLLELALNALDFFWLDLSMFHGAAIRIRRHSAEGTARGYLITPPRSNVNCKSAEIAQTAHNSQLAKCMALSWLVETIGIHPLKI